MAIALGWVAMVAAAIASLVCVLAVRPRHPSTVVAMSVMVVAMIDMGTGHRLLPPIGWAAVLIFVGVFVVAVPRSPDPRCRWQHGLALVAAAVIMITAPHSLAAASASAPGHPGHQLTAGHPGGWPGGGWLLGLLVAGGYAVLAGAAVLRPADRPAAPRLQLAQVAATSSCLALMALLGLAA